jgi:hypothetical protein
MFISFMFLKSCNFLNLNKAVHPLLVHLQRYAKIRICDLIEINRIFHLRISKSLL